MILEQALSSSAGTACCKHTINSPSTPTYDKTSQSEGGSREWMEQGRGRGGLGITSWESSRDRGSLYCWILTSLPAWTAQHESRSKSEDAHWHHSCITWVILLYFHLSTSGTGCYPWYPTIVSINLCDILQYIKELAPVIDPMIGLGHWLGSQIVNIWAL